MEGIKKALDENGINLSVTKTGTKGFYIPKLRTIFVSEDLTEEEQKMVILHELEHGLSHSEFSILYESFVYHTKMEYEADRSMIDYLIQENDGYYNYSGVLEEFGLGLGWESRL